MMLDKQSLRTHFSELRKTIPDKAAADEAILTKLISHPTVSQAQTICCYVSYHEEVDTHRFIEWALSQGKTVCIPRVVGNDLSLFAIKSLTDCVPGFKGILEPPADAPLVQPTSVDLFILLGLAFDASGYRLGYGKGFTDRLLAGLRTYSIGLGYTDQVVYELPRTDYDVPVHEIITDSVSLTI